MGRQRLTWPRTELRGQVTHRPLRRLRFHRAPEMPEPGGNPGLMAVPVVRGPQPNKRENARRARETVVTEGNRRTWGSGGSPPGNDRGSCGRWPKATDQHEPARGRGGI